MTCREKERLAGLKSEQEQGGKAINHSGVYRVGLDVWAPSLWAVGGALHVN